MTRKELLEWLDTHPTSQWTIVHVDEGHMRILFWFDEDEEDSND